MAKAVRSTLQPGDKVTIYQDPITEQELEGPAILVRRVRREMLTAQTWLEHWLVRFADEPELDYTRAILCATGPVQREAVKKAFPSGE